LDRVAIVELDHAGDPTPLDRPRAPAVASGAVPASTRPVFVRGTGAISPLGRSWPETRAALAAGKSAVAPVTRFDVEGFPCTVAAGVEGELGEDRRMGLA